MTTINDTFEAKLRRLIDERIQDLKDEAVVGVVGDPHRTNYRNGQVGGLTIAIGLCDEVKTELNKR